MAVFFPFLIITVTNFKFIWLLFSNSINFAYFCVGYQSRFTSIPSKPTFTHSGNNLTLIWRYHLSHADKPHFRWLVFGLWTNGDISTPLMSVSKNGKLVSYSDRIAWLGNKTTAAFRLHGVTIQDGGVYGCKLDFGAHVVRDSVRLAIIGKYVRNLSNQLFFSTFVLFVLLHITYLYNYILPTPFST